MGSSDHFFQTNIYPDLRSPPSTGGIWSVSTCANGSNTERMDRATLTSSDSHSSGLLLRSGKSICSVRAVGGHPFDTSRSVSMISHQYWRLSESSGVTRLISQYSIAWLLISILQACLNISGRWKGFRAWILSCTSTRLDYVEIYLVTSSRFGVPLFNSNHEACILNALKIRQKCRLYR